MASSNRGCRPCYGFLQIWSSISCIILQIDCHVMLGGCRYKKHTDPHNTETNVKCKRISSNFTFTQFRVSKITSKLILACILQLGSDVCYVLTVVYEHSRAPNGFHWEMMVCCAGSLYYSMVVVVRK